MSKFNSIEISNIVSLHPNVEVHKYLGVFEHVCYAPTRSSIQSFRNYYDAYAANVLRDIAIDEGSRTSITDMKELRTSENGNYRLDICISKDCRFVAFQLFERHSMCFEPFCNLCILEGEQARAFENLLA